MKQEGLRSVDRLVLALNLIYGLACAHGVDYPDGSNATFVHNDINPVSHALVHARIHTLTQLHMLMFVNVCD